jgi:hypothetical protein
MVDVATDPTPWGPQPGNDPAPAIIENLTLNMALQSYVSANSDCIAFAVNQAMWDISSGGTVEIENLDISQITEAHAKCATAQGLPVSNRATMQSAFNSLAKTSITTANTQLSPDAHGTETVSTLDNLSKVFNETSIQECVAGALNRAAIKDVNTRNSVFVTGSVVQLASAEMQTCINMQDIPGMDGTAQDVAKQFAQAAKSQITSNTTTGRIIACSVYKYWINKAIVLLVLATILLVLRVVIFKRFRV